ncbi:MAG: Lin0512 family protein [Pseudomonadota bacterium]
MPRRRMVMELGMGVDIRGRDATEAACRAVENAIRQNSLSVADAFGLAREQMLITAIIGVQAPDEVDVAAVAALFPYGQVAVEVRHGGMDAPGNEGTTGPTLANAVVLVDLDLPEDHPALDAGQTRREFAVPEPGGTAA